MPLTSALASNRRQVLQRRIRLIVAATITYNVLEAIIALTAGRAASSAALIGFGLDSVVEVLSAAAIAWQFTRKDPERWEKVTVKAIGLAFFALAAYVTVDAIAGLVGLRQANHSPIGIALTAVSLAVMPLLSLLERRTGRELGSASAVADSKQTLICSYLSAAVLIGLLLNTLLGWAWADSVAALVIVVFAVREGLEAWRGDACKQPISALTGDREAATCDCC